MMMLSPFFGYALRPGYRWEPPQEWLRENFPDEPAPAYLTWPANNHGFISDRDYPTPPSARDFVVGVFGSSVAQGLAFRGRAAIIRALEANPAVAGRKVVVLNFTQGGFKQPQQLMVLSYFAALGQRFDLVLNMDGVTGAYIGWENVARHGIDPLMPTARFLYGLQNYLIDSTAAKDAERTGARVARIDALLHQVPSGIAHYLLLALRSRLVERQAQVLSEEGRAEPGRSYMIQLGAAGSPDFARHVDRIADTWARSSLAMAAVAQELGSAYLHVLEPNQYLGRKPIAAAEQRIFAAASEPMTQIVPPMYAALRRASRQLEGRVALLDATGAFEGHAEPLYIDHCCHFNRHGYDLLIANVLGPALRNLALPQAGERKAPSGR
jgi:hypothetical protein